MRGLIIEEVSKITIPIIQIIGMYVVIFGHLSPGGGFASGAIIAISLILNRIILKKKVGSFDSLIKIQVVSLMMYVLLKGYSILNSNIHFGPVIPVGKAGNIFAGGLILPLNLIVSVVVSITIYFMFCLFYEGEV